MSLQNADEDPLLPFMILQFGEIFSWKVHIFVYFKLHCPLKIHFTKVWKLDNISAKHVRYTQNIRLRCLLCIKGLVICFYLGWSGSILQFRQNIIKIGSKSWLLTCSSNITFPSISYYFHIPKIFLNFFPHTGKNRNRRKSNLLP